jgi:hypothetical protein
MPIHNSSQADELAGQRRQRSASTSCLRCAVSGNDQRASGAGVLLAALVAVALLAPSSAASGVQAVRPCTGLPWGALKHADERLGDKAPVSMPGKSPLLALRLKGGRGCTGTRNSCKQRKYHMKTGVMKDAKRNRPIALSHRPCTGSWAKSKMERWHGTAVIQQVRAADAVEPGFVHVCCRGLHFTYAFDLTRHLATCRLCGSPPLGHPFTILAQLL